MSRESSSPSTRRAAQTYPLLWRCTGRYVTNALIRYEYGATQVQYKGEINRKIRPRTERIISVRWTSFVRFRIRPRGARRVHRSGSPANAVRTMSIKNLEPVEEKTRKVGRFLVVKIRGFFRRPKLSSFTINTYFRAVVHILNINFFKKKTEYLKRKLLSSLEMSSYFRTRLRVLNERNETFIYGMNLFVRLSVRSVRNSRF